MIYNKDKVEQKIKENNHLNEIMAAYLAGKTIEIRTCYGWTVFSRYDFDSPAFDYRIKPEPKWRPCISLEEAMKFLDVGVKHKNNASWNGNIQAVGHDLMKTQFHYSCKTYKETFDTFVTLDGNPIGVEIND